MSERKKNIEGTRPGIVADLQPSDDQSAIVRKLGAISLLSQEEIDFLEGLQNNTLAIAAGTDFITDGNDLRTTFIMMEGWAKRYVLLPSGRRQILSYVLPGDILGLHVNFRSKATYSAAALTDCKVAVVDPRRMLEISQKFPVLAAGLSWCTAREFAILGDQAVRLGRLGAQQRIAHLLLELRSRMRLIGETNGEWLDFPMTQADLADTLGLSIVHVNRQLMDLRQRKIITLERDHVHLDDVKALSEMSHFDFEHLAEFQI
ncbi:Crp/Fnr family transcriptional regulator [Aestuariibius insulae]|uniref:Crp/Fnr family transcriptional regulator n=1 Tax=Aestuariibius insulae TaxID=2058287 RepID=UPI00345EC876